MGGVYFELYEGLPRQGPGSDEATLDALRLVPGLPESPDIIDMGCGTGRQSVLLASVTGGRVTAVDTHRPFLDELDARAAERGLSERITTLNCSMDSPELPDGAFDLVWAEGAVYIMGFAEGLACWKRLLRPGGSIAVTEISWLVEDPPVEASEFWAENYPAMRGIPGNIDIIREAGYEPVDTLVLPESAWWEDYYLMLEKRISVLRKANAGDPAMMDALDHAQREMDLYRAHSSSYGYVFYVMRKPL